ncbi:reverse transcriptase [Gossypium australe]|uniref:Reverse transcriptase n=1 Tax=Gossypium australe TaxID=47621 RepID=A0A5B6VK49_9ROSI|nr:reverse transcriptase [Gossypium australe]
MVNCQGCASLKFPRVFWEYNREHKPDLVGLLETRVNGVKVDSVIVKLGFDFLHRVKVVEFLEILISNRFWSLLYMVVLMVKNRSSYEKFLNILCRWMGLRGGRFIGKRCTLFSEFMNSMGLHDLGFSGLNFTWNKGGDFERLDRVVCNDAWILKFPLSKVLHLQKLKSDHRPFKLTLMPDVQPSSMRPFRFLADWVKHLGFSGFVKKNWEFLGDMSTTHVTFIDQVKLWNNELYGHIMHRKNLLKKKLDNVQKAID